MADVKIDPFDVGALERSVNDSAGRVSGIWLSFVAFSAYLAAAASMISHRQILLEEPIKLPTVNIDLPLVASAIVLPLLFVVYHVFVLLQVVLLARTADTYNEAIEHYQLEPADCVRLRQRLANTLFAQLFAGSRREREGMLGALLRVMAWITLAIAPVCVLIVFEIKFLPYHHAAITWTHRALIIIDLLAVLLLWEGAVHPRRDITWRSLTHRRVLAAGAAAILLLSNLLFTYPGEAGRMWMAWLSQPSTDEWPECHLPGLMDAMLPTGFDRLSLLGELFVDEEKVRKIVAAATINKQQPFEAERTRIFRTRDLRCAHLAATDLRYADFSGADLSGAILSGAHIDGAMFAGAQLAGAILDGAQLQGSWFAPRKVVGNDFGPARLPRSSLVGTQLQQAMLDHAELADANLKWTQLQGASLQYAQLPGASLEAANLTGATLDQANLRGVLFRQALMPGASFDSAHMQGSRLEMARMQGASLNDATIHGAVFYETSLQGATFHRSKLQGAVFNNAHVGGATFIEAQLQGIEIKREWRFAAISHSFPWRSRGFHCDHIYVAEPNLDAIIEVRNEPEPGSHSLRPKPVPATDQEIAALIAQSLKDVPDHPKFNVTFSKDELRQNLQTRLTGPTSDSWTQDAQAWTACAEGKQAQTPDGVQDFTRYLTTYACRFVSDPNPFVTGLLRGWTSGELVETGIAKQFATSLLSAVDRCPGVQKLSDDTKKLLQDAINPAGE